MNRSEARSAAAILSELDSQYRITVVADWGLPPRGRRTWRAGSWAIEDLRRLRLGVRLLAQVLGGPAQFVDQLQGISVVRRKLGSHSGEALAHQVSFSNVGALAAWTVVHEFAHAWDAAHGWQLSRALERDTGGRTNPILGRLRRRFWGGDCGASGYANEPGRRGRLPGCNADGYFYGAKPSGSNWRFNRKEDFAESVAMYIGWAAANPLSKAARARISRYRLPNGARDYTGLADNWADYRKYFYPEAGDYSRTRRWHFVHALVRGASAKSPPRAD